MHLNNLRHFKYLGQLIIECHKGDRSRHHFYWHGARTVAGVALTITLHTVWTRAQTLA